MEKVVERRVLMLDCFTSPFGYLRRLMHIKLELLDLRRHFALLEINLPYDLFQLYDMTLLQHQLLFQFLLRLLRMVHMQCTSVNGLFVLLLLVPGGCQGLNAFGFCLFSVDFVHDFAILNTYLLDGVFQCF
jgi:hypothetical protein